ncbi:5-oxoprolinase [Sulfolobus sp. S-194]|uniref:hydantoinase B/oxoprolinase family protein n=1 Tax=Sulfolobus sp. S-194 TaxID=2512240 RepID=UPI001436DA84|nr:hydantoinase B/oxoprolinase family protein [Sulfolobus sp. S-194]QIW24572.1 5-oxoprolinase [Sulfolobus sp. S-194]
MVSWEVINKATIFIAEEMGVTLKKSALSPNIRERMDHSCAIVDREGKIVAQAEHIPVHLGSFRIAVKNVLKFAEELKEGESLIFNDPYISGTHLNDVGILTPIYYESELIGYVINKAHHVDVGGPLPGSINPNAKTLYEEGIIIPPMKLTDEVIKFIKENFKVPEVSIGDLNAQVSANKIGVIRVKQLIEKYGKKEVLEGWDKSIDHTKSLVLQNSWKEGVYEAEDYLEFNDNLLNITLHLHVKNDKIVADFTGTHKQIDGPLNAVLGVTYSAVSFAIRSALNKDISTNEGFYSFIEVIAEEGSLVNPKKPAAVGGGNVETSQRIADVTFLALSRFLPYIPAASSGTMMNVMMGGIYQGKYWSYYETIAGGSGARPNSDGVSAVHTNMTNTLNTPIEIAEMNYPIIFTSYKIRGGSGGKGFYKGGDGIIRSFKVLSPTRLSILADRFKTSPWGLNGGENGKPGKVYIIKKGEEIEMPSKFTIDLNEGDEVIIETPGGGGYSRS